MKNKKDLIREIVLIFIIGCIFGYIMEFVWYFVKHGKFINVQGVLYGPFKPIYGLGFLLVSAISYKLKTKSKIYTFIFLILFGTFFEYSLSLFQEHILHTKTWNYSNFSFNINGHIYLPYCIAWGILGYIWVIYALPKLKKLIQKIPYIVAYIFGILMIFDLLLSAIAVYEYSNRQNNIRPTSKILKLMDRLYPDDIMQHKYGKLRAIKK